MSQSNRVKGRKITLWVKGSFVIAVWGGEGCSHAVPHYDALNKWFVCKSMNTAAKKHMRHSFVPYFICGRECVNLKREHVLFFKKRAIENVKTIS